MASREPDAPLLATARAWLARPRARARARRWLARALLALPGIGVMVLDGSLRHAQIASWAPPTRAFYATTLLLGGILWASLAAAAGARRAWTTRVALVCGAGLVVGAQVYFFDRYGAYMSPRAVLVGTSMLPSVGQQLWSDRSSFVRALLLPIALAAVLPFVCARIAPVSRKSARRAMDVAFVATLVATFGVRTSGPLEHAAAPDILYMASLGRLASARWTHDRAVDRVHPGLRTPIPVPTVRGRRDVSVLFVVTESVRASDACSVAAADCPTTPFTNTLLPDRFGFSQMRALDSTTAASLAVLWAGVPPTASREALHSAPLLWEYAHAAGFDTAYWTSQNLFFANAGTWLEGLPLSRRVSATDLDVSPTYETGADDGRLVDVVLGDLPSLQAPWVGVVHLSNTHFPYVIDERDAPFQPQSRAMGKGDAARVHNRYRDAIFRQDALVARLVRGARALPGGDRLVIAFVSDHGEQIRERGAIGHTWNVYDEEVRVPFWLDAPDGVLTPAQEDALRASQDARVTQLDVLPTLLDVLGLWSQAAIAPLRAAMPGESLLAGGAPDRPIVLTNCSSIFACASRNWGAMRGPMKLLANENDARWKCFDTARDPLERTDLGAAACGDLRALAEANGRGHPF